MQDWVFCSSIMVVKNTPLPSWHLQGKRVMLKGARKAFEMLECGNGTWNMVPLKSSALFNCDTSSVKRIGSRSILRIQRTNNQNTQNHPSSHVHVPCGASPSVRFKLWGHLLWIWSLLRSWSWLLLFVQRRLPVWNAKNLWSNDLLSGEHCNGKSHENPPCRCSFLLKIGK